MNGLEIYNDILANTHNLKGTWEVTAENYLNVTGNTNGSIILFDKTVGALGDFILEWTAEQKGGSYIHSNLCPSLRYTPEDAGIEGGGDNYAMLVYLCNYGGNPGTFNLRTENGTKPTVNTSGVSLNIDTVYTFKFERIKGKYRLYQDGVLINEASDVTDKKLYLGWYLWYGGSNADYQTNFILREYNLTKINTYHYLDTIGLTSLWSKIKSLFATKTELGSKANDADVVHKSGNETIAGTKTFNDNITIIKNSPFCNLFTNNYIKGEVPSSNVYQGVRFYDDPNSSSANHITGGFEIAYDTTGYTIVSINARTYVNGSQLWKSINLRVPNDSTRSIDFYPISNSEINLGTSTNKWKTINGINPGALSLPNLSTSMIQKSLPASGGVIVAEVDGWLEIRAKATSESANIQLYIGGGGAVYAKNTGDNLMISIPMRTGAEATIYYKDIETSVCRLVPCMGNV